LQPTLGVGLYDPTEDEIAMLAAYDLERKNRYKDQLSSFYLKARERCKPLRFVFDLTDAFKGRSGMYYNARHPNAKGYRRLAQVIFAKLMAVGALSQTRTQDCTRRL
jgi:hypothetical protein